MGQRHLLFKGMSGWKISRAFIGPVVSNLLVRGDVVVGVFADVGLHQLARLVQQFLAVGAQMTKMQSLSELQIPIREVVDGLLSGLLRKLFVLCECVPECVPGSTSRTASAHAKGSFSTMSPWPR